VFGRSQWRRSISWRHHVSISSASDRIVSPDQEFVIIIRLTASGGRYRRINPDRRAAGT
jgi:hypothetical protein